MKILKMIPEKCTGCMRCELACSYEQTGTFRPSKSVIRVSAFENHTSYAPYTCPQCDEAWCMTACPIEAISISSPGAKEIKDDLDELNKEGFNAVTLEDGYSSWE